MTSGSARTVALVRGTGSARRSPGKDPWRTASSALYVVGLALSSLVGLLHFFAPYAFAWYSYIPDAPPEIYASVDYVNFLFSLLLLGLSALLLGMHRRAFEGSPEVLTFYSFLVLVWLGRVVVAVAIPWPTSLHTWLLVGALTILSVLLVPAVYLLNQLRRPREAPSVPTAS